jgi:nucleoside-diphosphate-sugar epimerase
MNKVLVFGVNGAIGCLVVSSLLGKGISVIAIVRDKASCTLSHSGSGDLKLIEASISELTTSQLATYFNGCDVVISCLGHNLSFKGIFGKPRQLVTDAVIKVTKAIESLSPAQPIKLILMNTTGNSNRDVPEKPPLSQRFVVALLRILLPPHADNEHAADYLRTQVGQHNQLIKWVAVRPDGLINVDAISPYVIYPSPIRNVIFDAGQTSRINVAEFMSELVVDEALWAQWQGQMPVIYNRD